MGKLNPKYILIFGPKSILKMSWHNLFFQYLNLLPLKWKSLEKIWWLHSKNKITFSQDSIWKKTLVLTKNMYWKCPGITIFLLPGQNQYLGFFEINLYKRVGKCILYYIPIKCEAFWILLWVIKLLIGVKK